ncbi:DUF262 domain-containing protein [Aquimarina algicola]|uniref:DUF262 domain-containing protein n=1 Tax=Aquimarina algicola TaxID=2589995 RepID=A0A504J5Q0_9FLAO|nr:DUF262 domain-containing protein [Aquimarina algicola]TPN82953.1 DUF262 domain-containing protein [Aquimarina algicola]
MDASKKTINDIFNGNRVLEIPFFQRAYVWGKPQWERLLMDMEYVSLLNKPYFLGSVILKQQSTDTSRNFGDVRTLIDGQQRLTTLSIFFKVLCLKTNQNTSFDRVFKLINNDIALYHNHNDIESFTRILQLDTEEVLEGTDAITEAYHYFKRFVMPDKLNFNKILNNLTFVGIDLAFDEDEQKIFDTINSLGVRLTTAELLKNHLFTRDDVDTYNNNWKDIFEKDEETRAFWDKEVMTGRLRRQNIDLFFYSLLQIKIQDPNLKVSSEDKNIFSRVEGLFNSYKRFIAVYNIEKEVLIQEIKQYALLYKRNFNFNIVREELSHQSGMDRINMIIFGLDNTTLFPYILYVLKEVTDQDKRNELFEYLETYIMRRIVCRTSNKNYNQLFSDRFIANRLLDKEQLKLFIEKRSDKVNFMPNNDDLKTAFHESKHTNKQSAGILYMIESKIRNKARHSTALLGLNRYSLEHIMPKKWENHWNTVATEDELKFRNKKLLTLGNLTIITTSLNASIRDASWDVKREGRNTKNGLKQFATGIETFGTFIDEPEWNEEVIARRANYLYEQAKNIWTI